MSSPAIAEVHNNPVIIEGPNDGVLRLVLANPPANALSDDVLAALYSALEAARDDAQTRVIVIAAEGKIFSAGQDLKELSIHHGDGDGGKAYFAGLMRRCADMMMAIVGHPKPIIAEVSGLATAAGCQLVASCDLAIASEESTFCTPGVHIGLFCSTPMVALSRTVHRKHAMEMLLTGEAITPSHAREIGLVNRVVPAEYLTSVTRQYARKIAEKPAVTLKIGKAAFYNQADMALRDAYEYAAGVMVENMLHNEAKEGIGAFLEHRDPVWPKQ